MINTGAHRGNGVPNASSTGSSGRPSQRQPASAVATNPLYQLQQYRQQQQQYHEQQQEYHHQQQQFHHQQQQLLQQQHSAMGREGPGEEAGEGAFPGFSDTPDDDVGQHEIQSHELADRYFGLLVDLRNRRTNLEPFANTTLPATCDSLDDVISVAISNLQFILGTPYAFLSFEEADVEISSWRDIMDGLVPCQIFARAQHKLNQLKARVLVDAVKPTFAVRKTFNRGARTLTTMYNDLKGTSNDSKDDIYERFRGNSDKVNLALIERLARFLGECRESCSQVESIFEEIHEHMVIAAQQTSNGREVAMAVCPELAAMSMEERQKDAQARLAALLDENNPSMLNAASYRDCCDQFKAVFAHDLNLGIEEVISQVHEVVIAVQESVCKGQGTLGSRHEPS